MASQPPGPASGTRPPAAGLVAVLAALAILAPLPASAGAAKPDAHDRALVARLDAKVATFRAVAAQTSSAAKTTSLDRCPYLKKHPKQAFAAVFVLLPVLMVELVNQFKPQLTDLRDTIEAMHAHSPLFRRWLAAQAKSFALILRFDNHGRTIDLCAAATVLLNKTSSTAAVRRALGIDPALIAKLFSTGSSTSGAIARLNPKMRAFLVAAGMRRKNAVALTS